MKRFKNILVAVDTRRTNDFLLDASAEIAQHNAASLTLVDVVPEFPWVLRMKMQDHAQLRAAMLDEKREQLEALADPLRKKRIEVGTRVLLGATSTGVIREVLREGHDLVLARAKGQDSGRLEFFGTTGIRLLRQCPCAVWLVAPGETVRFAHVLACVDTSTGDEVDAELNDKVLQLASSISRYHGGRYSILHAWSIRIEQTIRNRMRREDFALYQQSSGEQARASLAECLERHGEDVGADHVHLQKGEPAELIPRFVRKNAVDLVVMGTVGRSGVSGLVIGNTAEQVLARIECSVLAVKPSSFVSPIRPE